MANSTLPTLAVAAMIVASAPTAGWADDQAQAEACQKTLGLFAADKIDEAVETMFFEAREVKLVDTGADETAASPPGSLLSIATSGPWLLTRTQHLRARQDNPMP